MTELITSLLDLPITEAEKTSLPVVAFSFIIMGYAIIACGFVGVLVTMYAVVRKMISNGGRKLPDVGVVHEWIATILVFGVLITLFILYVFY